MRLPRKIHVLLLLPSLLAPAHALAQELPRAVPEAVGMSSERLDRLTAALDRYVEEGRLAGATATVLRNGNVVYDEAVGYRDLESDAPMTTDAIFRIASQTKAIVSVGIMMLQEEGALLISDPLSRYLPAFRNTTVASPREGGGYDVLPASRPITLRHLLTHTAGIAYGAGPGGDRWEEAGITGWYFAHRDEPVRRTVDRMASLPFQAQPGEAFVYGYNTDILGAVIEEVSGQALDDFVRERILEPLDMRDTHFYLPPEKRGRLATVYGFTGNLGRAPDGAGMQAQGQYVDGPRTSFSGGAGLLSTTRDYARFLQMLLNGGELNGRRLLSPTTIDLMTRNHVGDLEPFGRAGRGFGLGFQVLLDAGRAGEHGSVGEYGWGGAYHSTYWVDPVENLVVVYLTQVIPAQGLDDQARLRALVYSALLQSAAGSMHSMMH
ncbi:MAG TPA: serine hydrolase domain-containing protein [Longimicrobiales bacterium]|nr:serine hydrolase domain-containing protein [Longimicrobiales bacterium]